MTAAEFKRRYARLFVPRPAPDPEVERRFDEARNPQLSLRLDADPVLMISEHLRKD